MVSSAEDSSADVAPFAGAWIEILALNDPDLSDNVAPFAGAWIEILAAAGVAGGLRSLPSRERGLKCVRSAGHVPHADVAPFAGAWIEMPRHIYCTGA